MPYLATFFRQSDEVEFLEAMIILNDHQVHAGKMQWEIQLFQDMIDTLLGQAQVTKLVVQDLSGSPTTISELFNQLASQDIHSFNEIKFHHFRSKCSPLKPDVLQRLKPFAANLTKLEVSKMYKLT